MAVCYNKLFKLMIDKKVSASALRRAADISPNTMTKIHNDENVSMEVMCRICEVMEADFSEIMEYIPEKEERIPIRRK